jgi:pyruvate,water dikinase
VISNELETLDVNDSQKLQKTALKIQKMITTVKMSKELERDILLAYYNLGKNVPVAVRSSATAEDLPDASFAGQQATFLNIRGDKDLIKYVRAAWASLFEARAIFYRVTNKFDHMKVGIAVPVQKMVQSDISGVMFSINPVTNDPQTVVVEAVWGLGENIVQGVVTPDHYEVEKGSWDVLRVQVAPQKIEMIRKMTGTKNYTVPKSRQNKQKLSEKEIIALAKLAAKLQQHYMHPQDSEWAIENGKIYLVQTRPITTVKAVHDKGEVSGHVQSALNTMKLILEGEPASPGIYSGKVRHILTPREIHLLQPGEVMVTDMTTPDFVPAMKKAGGLITNRGGQTSHAAIVSRELGLPCVVGTEKATSVLKNGQEVTLSGAAGLVYDGALKPELLEAVEAISKQSGEVEHPFQPTATKIYVNLAEPELAASVAKRHVDGIGLLRAEFMIAQLGYHPKKLIRDRKEKVFVRHLVKGLMEFCEAFSPDRPVVYRATDFKTNEYRHLIGGEEFEPEEENPLLGYRGAYRYMTDQRVFELEIEAIKQVRAKYTNLWMMIPFVRSVKEFQEVRRILYKNGLRRSSTFKLWMMAEIPENVIMIDDYIDAGIDGISIGTNDLTMMMLGTDRDNSLVASEYDERHPAVQWALERLVRKARAKGITVSVCGQGPSTYHELAENLVRWGVTSLSVAPDTIELTREIVAETERKLVTKPRQRG